MDSYTVFHTISYLCSFYFQSSLLCSQSAPDLAWGANWISNGSRATNYSLRKSCGKHWISFLLAEKQIKYKPLVCALTPLTRSGKLTGKRFEIKVFVSNRNRIRIKCNVYFCQEVIFSGMMLYQKNDITVYSKWKDGTTCFGGFRSDCIVADVINHFMLYHHQVHMRSIASWMHAKIQQQEIFHMCRTVHYRVRMWYDRQLFLSGLLLKQIFKSHPSDKSEVWSIWCCQIITPSNLTLDMVGYLRLHVR